MIGILFVLAGQRLQLRFKRVDACGPVDHLGIGPRAFAGGVVGRILAFETGRAAAREDRALDRPHLLFAPSDPFADLCVLRGYRPLRAAPPRWAPDRRSVLWGRRGSVRVVIG